MTRHTPFRSTPSRTGRRRRSAVALLAASAAALTAGCSSGSSEAAPAPVVDRVELQAQLDALVALGVPGVVLSVRDRDESAVLTSGLADLEARTPMSAGSTFRIASMTKPYTATVVLQLVDEGVLHLDDTVEQWLPGIVVGADRISIRQLLDHTSGVADYFADPAVLQPYLEGDFEHVWTPEQLIQIADRLGATAAPGSARSYSNTNYAIVGRIVERATGRSLGDEMQSRIFDTLQLAHTSFATDTTLDPAMAHGYLMGGDAPIDATGVFPFPWGAGNIVSDAADAATFYGALLGGDLLSPELLAEMVPSDLAEPMPYGLGIMAWHVPCGTAYGHDGGFAGYSTRALALDDGRQVVILANSITFDDHLATDPAADAQFDAIIDAAICG